MKLNEITIDTVKGYLRCDDEDLNTLFIFLDASRQYIYSYTGLSQEQAQQYDDLSIAALVLCAEMYDNRQMTVQNDKINPIVKQILDSYSRNYLPREV